LLFILWFIPETKGKSLEELEHLLLRPERSSKERSL
jgi:hypothetical protein